MYDIVSIYRSLSLQSAGGVAGQSPDSDMSTGDVIHGAAQVGRPRLPCRLDLGIEPGRGWTELCRASGFVWPSCRCQDSSIDIKHDLK